MNNLLCDAPPTPSSSSFPIDPLTRIQGISFPPHHSDKPDARPSCKGFALVTFAHATDCEYLKTHWPWFREARSSSEKEKAKTDEEKGVDSAVEISCLAWQHEFRVITKERWLQLKAEYLSYHQKLVEGMNAYQDSQQSRPRRASVSGAETPGIMSTDSASLSSTISPVTSLPDGNTAFSLNPSSPYPLHCLVFVKHVHPETTKTTLRNLFSHGLKPRNAQPSQKNLEGLDYVDFSKGMDTVRIYLSGHH